MAGTFHPTVKNLLVEESYKIVPESPGFVIILVSPLMVAGLVGVIVSDPVPAFLKLIYHPDESVVTLGREKLPEPEVHTNVAARLELEILGDVDT